MKKLFVWLVSAITVWVVAWSWSAYKGETPSRGLFTVPEKRQSGNFLSFLATEIEAAGGEITKLEDMEVQGKWTAKRDSTGVLIQAKGVEFDALTNALNLVYGLPSPYLKAMRGNGPTYRYGTKEHISVFVSETKDGAEVTVLKRLF